MTNCPSCGRYVGPYDACPHCGAALEKRTPLRLLKLAALVLALGGLAFLWFFATQTDVPTVEIGQADAMMNLGYVRVEGLVTRPPSYDPATDYLSFWVSDDTGELHVAVYQKEAQDLIRQRRVPGLGDRVSVEGTLRVREDYVSLTLNVPERLEIHRNEPVVCHIGDIATADEFTRVHVRGQVRGIRAPYAGLTLIELRDSTGAIELAASHVITALGQSLSAISIGQTVDVIAAVSLYKETAQLSLADAADFVVLDEMQPFSSESTIGQMDTLQIGHWVGVTGQLTDVSPFSAGVKYTLDDGTGEITMLLWRDLYDQLTEPDSLAAGATVRVQGELTEYRGEMEVVPQLPLDIEVLVAAPQAGEPQVTSTVAVTPQLAIGNVGIDHLGKTVSVSGSIQDAVSFSKGFKFTLTDSTGQITLLAWLNTYDNIAGREGLRPGASVQVIGEIDQYDGELQIIPFSGADVLVLNPGRVPTPARMIVSLTDDDIGEWVSVEGRVARVETFGDGLRVYLDDGSDEIMLLLWRSVLQRIPGDTDLPTRGNQLRATGKVDKYQGAFEIVPALPFDLQTMPPALTKPTPITATVPIGGLHRGQIGDEVTVAAQVIDTASFSKGFKFTLDDGSGQIVLLMWHSAYDECEDAPLLNIGAATQATGKISEFESALQIEPGSGADVKVTTPGTLAVPQVNIDSIAGHVGQRIVIMARVNRLEHSENGTTVFVADDTGEAALFIWPNIVERIPDLPALSTSGTQVRIMGVVQEYQGDLEIVPALPYDVQVLE